MTVIQKSLNKTKLKGHNDDESDISPDQYMDEDSGDDDIYIADGEELDTGKTPLLVRITTDGHGC